MAKKKKAKKTVKARKPRGSFYVWVTGRGDYFEGRDRLEAALGDTDGSGMSLIDGGWDCSWGDLTEAQAKRLAARARRFKIVKKATIKNTKDYE